MTESRNVAGILQDLSVLYELSLSVGQSLDFDENCATFLRTLMSRKSIDFSAVWIRDRFASVDHADGSLVRSYATPAFRAPTRTIPAGHPLEARLEAEPIFSISHGQPGFDELVTETGIDRGTFAFYRLGEIGLLKLYSITRTEPFTELELNKLRNVIDKFTVSLEGCLDHARVRAAEQRRQELELQMLHAQKLESLGLLAGGVAHDFNNLLTAILGNAELARLSLSGGPATESLENIIAASTRAADLSSQLLAYSGGAPLVSGPVSLNALVEEMLRLTTVSVSKLARVRSELATELPPIEADGSQVQQVVMNLLTNASEALEGTAGDIVVRTGTATVSDGELGDYHLGEDRQPGEYVFLDVEDTGCGMGKATLQKLFDPFFTTKFTGRGLGLAALLGIVRGHCGAIRVSSAPGRGTEVRVLLPISTKALSTETGPDGGTAPPRCAGTVLVVDDEEIVRNLLKRLLERLGFEVLLANDGEQAVEIFELRRAEIELVFLDLTMPVMSGEEAFECIRALDQDVRVVLCSGYSEARVSARFEHHRPTAFLEKPFRIVDVSRVVDLALRGTGSRSDRGIARDQGA